MEKAAEQGSGVSAIFTQAFAGIKRFIDNKPLGNTANKTGEAATTHLSRLNTTTGTETPPTTSGKKSSILGGLLNPLKTRWASVPPDEQKSIIKVLRVAAVAIGVLLGLAAIAAVFAALCSNPFTLAIGILLLPIAIVGAGGLVIGGMAWSASILGDEKTDAATDKTDKKDTETPNSGVEDLSTTKSETNEETTNPQSQNANPQVQSTSPSPAGSGIQASQNASASEAPKETAPAEDLSSLKTKLEQLRKKADEAKKEADEAAFKNYEAQRDLSKCTKKMPKATENELEAAKQKAEAKKLEAKTTLEAAIKAEIAVQNANSSILSLFDKKIQEAESSAKKIIEKHSTCNEEIKKSKSSKVNSTKKIKELSDEIFKLKNKKTALEAQKKTLEDQRLLLPIKEGLGTEQKDDSRIALKNKNDNISAEIDAITKQIDKKIKQLDEIDKEHKENVAQLEQNENVKNACEVTLIHLHSKLKNIIDEKNKELAELNTEINSFTLDTVISNLDTAREAAKNSPTDDNIKKVFQLENEYLILIEKIEHINSMSDEIEKLESSLSLITSTIISGAKKMDLKETINDKSFPAAKSPAAGNKAAKKIKDKNISDYRKKAAENKELFMDQRVQAFKDSSPEETS